MTIREILARKCSTCDQTKELWVDCDRCGGDGDEEEPDWQDAMFEPYVTCSQCEGRGGWWLCERCASPEALRDAY
jgi:DnaJ-class molecular chaperone